VKIPPPYVQEYNIDQGSCFISPLFKDKNSAILSAFLPADSVFPKHYHKVHEYLLIVKGLLEVRGVTDGIRPEGSVHSGDVFGPSSVVYLKPDVDHEVIVLENTTLIGVTIPADEGYPDTDNGLRVTSKR
jgi:quercetin dioxygenase-like cupin family protein